MARGSRRTPLIGSAFIRTLAALDDTLPAPTLKDAFAEKLCGWASWTDTIALSEALRGQPTPAGRPPAATSMARHTEEQGELHRVKDALSKTLADAPIPVWRPRPGRAAAPDTPEDFAPHRQRYLACQQAMDTAIAPLRRRVRAAMAGTSPGMARLAALDAVMEHVVGTRERTLLAQLPLATLERHFKRLRPTAPDGMPLPASPDPGPWLAQFRRDMHGLLLAELEFRLQPVEALLDAFHPPRLCP